MEGKRLLLEQKASMYHKLGRKGADLQLQIDISACSEFSREMKYLFSLALPFVAVCLPSSAAAQDALLPEVERSPIGYETVAEAREALAQSDDVFWRDENGWPVAINDRERKIWSFSPPGYPAYPAVVMLQVTPNGTGSTVTQSVLCEASKDVCDDLVRTFAEMRGLPIPE